MKNVNVKNLNTFKAFVKSSVRNCVICEPTKDNETYVLLKLPFNDIIDYIMVGSYYGKKVEELKMKGMCYYDKSKDEFYYTDFYFGAFLYAPYYPDKDSNLEEELGLKIHLDYYNEFKQIVLNEIKRLCDIRFKDYVLTPDILAEMERDKKSTFEEYIKDDLYNRNLIEIFCLGKDVSSYVANPEDFTGVTIEDSLNYLYNKDTLRTLIDNLLQKKGVRFTYEECLYLRYAKNKYLADDISDICNNPQKHPRLYILRALYKACSDDKIKSVKATLKINDNIITTTLPAESIRRFVYYPQISLFDVPASDRNKLKEFLPTKWSDILPEYIEILEYRGKEIYNKKEVI